MEGINGHTAAPNERSDISARRDIFWPLVTAPISHGAFRLWHYLFGRASAKNQSRCWPEQRRIAVEMRCKRDSIPGWVHELVEANYLSVRQTGQNHHMEYTVLDGTGKPYFRGPEMGATRLPPKRNGVAPETGLPRGPRTRTIIDPTELIPRKGKDHTPKFEPLKRGLYRREYELMVNDAKEAIKAIKRHSDFWERALKKDVKELCDFLRDEAAKEPAKLDQNLMRVRQLESNEGNLVPVALNPKGRAIVEAWERRIREIKDAMNGVIG